MSELTPTVQPSKKSRLIATLVSALLLALTIGLNYSLRRGTGFPLLLLIPIAIAMLYAGRLAALSMCLLAVVLNLTIDGVNGVDSVVAIRNSFASLGIFLTVCILLDMARAGERKSKILKRMLLPIVSAALVAAMLVQTQFVIRSKSDSATSSSGQFHQMPASENVNDSDAAMLSGYLEEIASQLDQSLRASRPVLLGSRDPNGASCVPISRTGDVQDSIPASQADWNGGPGTTMAALYFFDRQRVQTALDDYEWHQSRLRVFLENQVSSNRDASDAARTLAISVDRLADVLKSLTDWPAGFTAANVSRSLPAAGNWPGYCFLRLHDAVARNDLSQAVQWVMELESAARSLRDLHRWVAFLSDNQLQALDFQRRCEPLFVSSNAALQPYSANSMISQFPAGVLSLNGLSNYFEVERQAELLFGAADLPRLAGSVPDRSAAINLPPELREAYREIRAVLSPHNAKILDRAAGANYERSYLANMLFRASRSDAMPMLVESVRRYNAHRSDGSVAELMDVLNYRGHSFASLEWADRYSPPLMDAAPLAARTGADAFMESARWTSAFYQSRADYRLTLTLRDTLANRVIDCIRATDLITSLFHNSGHGMIGHVRWSAGVGAHSVAAYIGSDSPSSDVLLADGMDFSDQRETWPDAYFHPRAWPQILEQNPPPYAVALYVRGLDNYVWNEGYIIRGPGAGALTRAPVPYLPGRNQRDTTQVFNGPFPN